MPTFAQDQQFGQKMNSLTREMQAIPSVLEGFGASRQLADRLRSAVGNIFDTAASLKAALENNPELMKANAAPYKFLSGLVKAEPDAKAAAGALHNISNPELDNNTRLQYKYAAEDNAERAISQLFRIHSASEDQQKGVNCLARLITQIKEEELPKYKALGEIGDRKHFEATRIMQSPIMEKTDRTEVGVTYYFNSAGSWFELGGRLTIDLYAKDLEAVGKADYVKGYFQIGLEGTGEFGYHELEIKGSDAAILLDPKSTRETRDTAMANVASYNWVDKKDRKEYEYGEKKPPYQIVP